MRGACWNRPSPTGCRKWKRGWPKPSACCSIATAKLQTSRKAPSATSSRSRRRPRSMPRKRRRSIVSAPPSRRAVRGAGVQQGARREPRARSLCAPRPRACAPRRGSRRPSSTGCSAGSARATLCLGRWRCCQRPDAGDSDVDRARENLSEAEAALNAVRTPPPAAPTRTRAGPSRSAKSGRSGRAPRIRRARSPG